MCFFGWLAQEPPPPPDEMCSRCPSPAMISDPTLCMNCWWMIVFKRQEDELVDLPRCNQCHQFAQIPGTDSCVLCTIGIEEWSKAYAGSTRQWLIRHMKSQPEVQH